MEAYQIFRRAHTPLPLFRCLGLLGRISLRQRRYDVASRYLRQAVRCAEQVRATVQVAFRQAFLEDKAAVYADLVWLHLQQHEVKKAHRLADLAKSRALADRLSEPVHRRDAPASPDAQRLLAEIEAVRQEYQQLTAPTQLGGSDGPLLRTDSDRTQARRLQLERRLSELWDAWELQNLAEPVLPGGFSKQQSERQHLRRLNSHEAMVEYVIINDTMFAFVSDQRGLTGWTQLGPVAPVRKTLELLQLNLDTTAAVASESPQRLPVLTRNARLLLLDLHRRLWSSLLPWVMGKQRVVIIPHGILHLVPFAGLYDGNQHLVQRVELTFAPSRDIWARCGQRAGACEPGRPDLVIGFNPNGQLPHIDEEADWVAGALGVPSCTGEAATRQRMMAAGPSRIVHLALHGEFRSDNPDFSTLLLADGPLTTSDAARLGINASLVVASGCETGLSRVTRGEELVGMLTAFLSAGCTSVLATRWRVDDKVTFTLMKHVYELLLSGHGKAAALGQAQAALARRDVHPLYWAAFFLVGDASPLS